MVLPSPIAGRKFRVYSLQFFQHVRCETFIHKIVGISANLRGALNFKREVFPTSKPKKFAVVDAERELIK